jgi:hypothetical protein
MKFPKMTPKRWFWSAMAAGLAWSASGWRWGGGPGAATSGDRLAWMAAVQNGLSQPLETAAIPPSFLFTTAQATFQGALAPGAAGDVPGTSEGVRQQVRDLQNENAQLKAMLVEANARLDAMKFLHALRIEPDDVLPATVIGFQAGPGSALLHVDKGALHGVKAGDVVVAPLEQVHLLGRIEKSDLGQVQSYVRLITDPTTRIQAQIVRPFVQPATATQPVQNLAITGEGMCFVEGMGNGQMQIRNLDVVDNASTRAVSPQKGDLVLLTDGHWPAKVQHMVLGQIDSVAPRKDQPMRYDIRVSPRVPVSTQRTVMILIRE